MNLRQRLANIIDPRHHANDIISGNDPLNIRYSDEYAWGTYPETPLAKIIKRRESDLKFQQAVVTSMAFSVGMGFHLKADTSTTGGKEALAIAEDFAKRCNLDEINQLVAMDAWATGNAFLEPLRDEHDRITDLQILPVSSFIRIQRDKHGAVTGYTQQHGGPQISLTPDVVMHFKWLPRDASAWGCGLGQALAKPGVGYKNAAGKIIKRPPWFAITEMVDDIVPKMLYAGVPRYDIGVKGQGDDNLAKIQAAFNRLDPGQHTIHNFETDIKTIALDTQSRQDSFLRKVDDEYTAGLMTPVGRMWSSNNYTYKSGDAAMEAHMPLIASYARAHKKFVEFDVLRPILMQYLPENQVRDAKVELVWGSKKPLDTEAIAKIWRILSHQKFDGRYDPDDVIDMLREAGAPLKSVDEVEQAVKDEVDEIHAMQARMPSPRERIEQMKLNLLRQVVGSHKNQ